MRNRFLYGLFLILSFFMFTFSVDAATIKDGVYTIKSALGSNKVIDVNNGNASNGTNVQLYDSNGSNAQKWNVKRLSDGYYEITSVINSNFSLDVSNAGRVNRTNVQIYVKNGTNAQRWYIKDAGDGYYYIISKCNGLYVDVYGGYSANRTNIQMYSGNGSKAQKFKFVEIITGEQSLEDGLYKISSFTDNTKFLGVKNFAKQGAKAVLSSSDLLEQKWKIKYIGNGYYTITSYADETLVLDVYGGSSSNGTPLHLYPSNSSNAQKWIIKQENGYYNLISAIDSMYMDIKGGAISDGTSIQIYQPNNTNAQKFVFTKIENETIKDGYYSLNSALDENKAVDTNTMIVTKNIFTILNDVGEANSQKWYIESIGDGLYSIKSALDTNYVLDVQGGSSADGTKVQTYISNGTNAQKWYIKSAGDGYYYIISKLGNKFLDIKGGSSVSGTNVQIYTGNRTLAQKFKLTETSVNENDVLTHLYEEDYYVINSKIDNTKVLDVAGAVKTNGTNVQLYSNNSSVAQIWYFQKLEDGYYALLSAMNKEIALTASSGNRIDGVNVNISKYMGLDTQKWAIKSAGNGYMVITSKANGLNIDVTDGKALNGTNIQLYQNNGADAQLFQINKYDGQKVYSGIDVSYHQKSINWDLVSKSGIDFVIIRAGYGGNWTDQDDKEFLNNVKACEEYNIPYGLYLYSYASEIDNDDTSAQSEANHMIRLLKQIEEYNYSPNLGTKVFLDIEDNSVIGAGKEQLTSVSDTFCSAIEASGYSCGIYSYKNFLVNYLNVQELALKYDIWLAEWLSIPSPTFSYAKSQRPSYNLTKYKYWQFASDGYINGITGRVDLDLGYDIFD